MTPDKIAVVALMVVMLLLTIISAADTKERGCADFNYGASHAALAGLNDVYVCPKDSISRILCQEKFPIKNVTEMEQSNIGFGDVVFFMLIGPNSRYDAFNWWLQFVKVDMNLVIVADSCKDNAASCSDSAVTLQGHLNTTHPHVKATIIRVNPWDNGYAILSCKLRTGMRKIYEQFSDKKYYFKIDTDTILFPRRFFSFLNTLHSISDTTSPYYFGTITESGSNLILCGNHPDWNKEGNAEKGGLCYAQGGAGYGLNNMAMKSVGDTPTCDSAKPDKWPEDVFTGLSIYNKYNRTVIHCGGFRSSELVSEQLFKHSISFHYIDSKWLSIHGNKLIHHYANPHEEGSARSRRRR